jgi:hypothetical protein
MLKALTNFKKSFNKADGQEPGGTEAMKMN